MADARNIIAMKSGGYYSARILWMVEEARRRGLPYAYLGYLVEQSPKMAYKLRFRPLEAFGAQGWQTVGTSA